MMPGKRPDTLFRRRLAALFGRWPMAAALALALAWSAPASAGEDMSESEYVLLPEYCRAQGNVSQKFFKKYYRAELVRKWQSALGENYNHYHHFCWGIVSISRAYKSPSKNGSREGMAKRAIADIGYLVERATPDCVLLPDVYTRLGEAYLLARDDRRAEAAFRLAWGVKPDYWRPYVWWAQRLQHKGKTREALAIAEEGQKNAPGVKALDDLVRELGGTPGPGKK